MISSSLKQSDPCSGFAEPGQGLLIDEPTVQRTLRRMIIRMEANHETREDMMQEALVHLCKKEQRHPGQSRSWYLHSVKFHLTHVKAAGRSLDSAKHRQAETTLCAENNAGDELPVALDDGIMSEVNAHDIFSLLLSRLAPMDQSILKAMRDGLRIREIGVRLGVSHVFVLRHRRNIASLAVRLGISPVTVSKVTRLRHE